MKPTLYLVDISSLIFRAFYAVKPLTAPDQTPVNALYGVVSMMKNLLEKKRPTHLCICCDRKEKGIRHEIFTEYKANRQEPPTELEVQFPLISAYLRGYPFSMLDAKGFEADDVIATMVKKFSDQAKIVIVSSDKDLMQLVGENVILYDTMKDVELGTLAVFEKFGVAPHQVADVQALCGDSVDNISGVPGIGPKTAAQWIQQYGTLEGVLAAANTIEGKMGVKLRSGADLALLSKKLVTLYDNVLDDSYTLNKFELSAPNTDFLYAFYQKYAFKTFLPKHLPGLSIADEEQSFAELNFKSICVTLSDFDTVIKICLSSDLLAFDTETTGVNPLTAKLVGVSLCADNQQAFYFPLGHVAHNLDWKEALKCLKTILENRDVKKVAQNVKFDLLVLRRHEIAVQNIQFDTMLASYLLNADGEHNLDALARRYLGHINISFASIVKKGEDFSQVDVNVATRYSAEDAFVTRQIALKQLPEINRDDLQNVLNNIEIPLVEILAQMEIEGVLVDRQRLQELEFKFGERLAELEAHAILLADESFNLNSPKQLGRLLFEKFKLPVIRKNKTGPSTDSDVLMVLAKQHELPKCLLEYRTLSKLQSTYVLALKEITKNDARVHTKFNQTVAATGRLSSSDPNLQNIPIRGELGREIRRVFVAPKSKVLLSADYSQIELRLLAEFSQDEVLRLSYSNNDDIHAQTASAILGVPKQKLTSDERSLGKTVNFGVLYGQSAFGLAEQLGVSTGVAKNFIDAFYAHYPQVQIYKQAVLSKARELGYVQTYLGRRRYFTDLKSQNKMRLQNAERGAFNTVFQGSAADLIKKSMLDVDTWLKSSGVQAKLLLQVHDELLFEVVVTDLEIVKLEVKRIMESAFDLEVPLVVGLKSGLNWADLK